MCGRTFCAIDPRCIQKSCEFTDPTTGEQVRPQWCDAPTDDVYTPSYNIGPTRFTPVLMSGQHCAADKVQQRVIQPMRWGLIPQWHKGDRSSFKAMHNNCRGETIVSKPIFSVPFKKGRRCVVVAQGFYEWKTEKGKKIPYLFSARPQDIKPIDLKKVKDENLEAKVSIKDAATESADPSKASLIFMAGIFDVWKESESSPLYSYSILTTNATGAVSDVHHRMPVLLESDKDIERWLNYEDYPSTEVMDLIGPKDLLTSHQVTDKVNNVRYQEPDCPLPVSKDESKPLKKGDIRNFFSKTESTKRKSELPEDPTIKKEKI
ncbi:abasic site processing protein HMCES-like [Watersipora subatra]|uniref:abasic site processing protein HMCES-like n=1 Tax=Watersipora subatra TaxID=2589382 RepID=UPI00355B538B